MSFLQQSQEKASAWYELSVQPSPAWQGSEGAEPQQSSILVFQNPHRLPLDLASQAFLHPKPFGMPSLSSALSDFAVRLLPMQSSSPLKETSPGCGMGTQ